jgi:multiple sugar transport system ATP-binding protein
MASVEMNSIGKTYPGGTRAVESCTLEIHDGEFLVLVGPSGCGKSTLLRMIAGLEDVTDGTISIDGRDMHRVPPKQRDIAMVFQNYALYPHMSARRNMAFALKLRKVPRGERNSRVEHVAKQLGIGELLDRKPGAMSGGQQQRVALGRAIVRQPKVFLFDEPLSNLDAKLRTQMRAELKTLHQQSGTTSIYVTHDQEEAMTLGDRVVVMHEGCIQQCGTPMEVYERPINRFVATFIGAPTMNMLEGQLEIRNGRTFFTGGGVELSLDTSPSNINDSTGSLGIRPEHFLLADDGAIKLEVEVSEPLGDATDVVGRCGDTQLVARLRRIHPPQPGDQLRLNVESDEVHLFDENGNAVS